MSVEVPTGVGAANSCWLQLGFIIKTFSQIQQRKEKEYILSRDYL